MKLKKVPTQDVTFGYLKESKGESQRDPIKRLKRQKKPEMPL